MKMVKVRPQPYLGYGLLMVALSLLTIGAIRRAPSWLLSESGFMGLGFVAVLFVLLATAWTSQKRSLPLAPRVACLRLATILWWSLSASAEVFYRFTPEEQSFAGRFSPAAYCEAAFWGVAFLACLLVAKGRYLRRAFSGDNKWLSFFALLCMMSAPFSPKPLYSLVWASRFFPVVVLLLLISATTHALEDIESFLWANFWGFAVVSFVPVVRAFLNPSGPFEGGRLWGSPDGLSIYAGVLALLALLMSSLCRRIWPLCFVLLGVAVMMMSGGKAGIGAGIISVGLFYMFQKRPAAAMGSLFAVFTVGFVVLLTTPLAAHLKSYEESGEASTLTGRTELWQAVWPEILHRPILGHGYLASKFVSEYVPGAFPEAGHLHNGFIDTLYNTGLLGATILVIIHVVIVRNLWRALKHASTRKARLVAVCLCAVYANLLINGLFNATFGGRMGAPFMLLFGLVVISEKLRTMTDRALPATF